MVHRVTGKSQLFAGSHKTSTRFHDSQVSDVGTKTSVHLNALPVVRKRQWICKTTIKMHTQYKRQNRKRLELTFRTKKHACMGEACKRASQVVTWLSDVGLANLQAKIGNTFSYIHVTHSACNNLVVLFLGCAMVSLEETIWTFAP